jgi:hypothetical protein
VQSKTWCDKSCSLLPENIVTRRKKKFQVKGKKSNNRTRNWIFGPAWLAGKQMKATIFQCLHFVWRPNFLSIIFLVGCLSPDSPFLLSPIFYFSISSLHRRRLHPLYLSRFLSAFSSRCFPVTFYPSPPLFRPSYLHQSTNWPWNRTRLYSLWLAPFWTDQLMIDVSFVLWFYLLFRILRDPINHKVELGLLIFSDVQGTILVYLS